MAGEQPDGRRLLFVCADPVGERMAGLGIRCWELARALAGDASVTVAHGGEESGTADGVRLLPFRPHAPGALRGPIAAADAIVAHPQWPLVNRWMRRSAARVVIDLYCPETLETLELRAGEPALLRRQMTATTVDRLHGALRMGHNFVCASETQRDLWLGTMLALRLLEPALYDRDPSLREVIDVVPFGLPAEAPSAEGGGALAAFPALQGDDEIVLWNGGIWSWLDAGTAIRAVAELAARRPSLKLVFMSGGSTQAASAQAIREARLVAEELGVSGSVVFFHDSWVPYRERGAWLGQASCALSAHTQHLESRFAYRTRVLDCLWAGLPVVCTSGDDLAEQIAREDLGAVAPPRDAGALAAALERVLERGRDSYREALRAAAERQTWPRVAAPIARWLAQPALPPRPGDAAEALGRPLPQRLRDAAYLAGGRAWLARR